MHAGHEDPYTELEIRARNQGIEPKDLLSRLLASDEIEVVDLELTQALTKSKEDIDAGRLVDGQVVRDRVASKYGLKP